MGGPSFFRTTVACLIAVPSQRPGTSGPTATAFGKSPTGMVAMTVSVAVSITVTLGALLFSFATYARAPSGVTSTPRAPSPAAMVAMTVLLAVEMTETSLLTKLGT